MKFGQQAVPQSVHWATPTAFYKELNDEFHFTFDPCPLTPTFDGLSVPWGERVFMNPPYGRQISKWIKKAVKEVQEGSLVVGLLPSRTDTAWWHDYVLEATEIRFIRGRLYFGDGVGRAPFPSVVVIWKP